MFHFCSTQIRSTSQFYHQKLLNNYHKKYKWKCFFEMIVFKLQNLCIINLLYSVQYIILKSDQMLQTREASVYKENSTEQISNILRG